MIAHLWAQQVISGKKQFSQVPKLLKEQVAAILTELSHEDLITG